ncbi:MAG: MerR family transcriptional regulator [Lachnospiraceae bacterium]|nr:MerR family transcriptional regulator [Clostridiales bacterium]MDY2608085.1 MerR family transcriptional regulator [Lachnospiraceae bacterium]
MEERRYIISDASKLIEVESHVLRYWEEELGIDIPRNEMGHRYYTDYYIELFKRVKELKDGGFQLKAIKMLIPELTNMNTRGNEGVEGLREELFNRLTDYGEVAADDSGENAFAENDGKLNNTNNAFMENSGNVNNTNNAFTENGGNANNTNNATVNDNDKTDNSTLSNVKDKEEVYNNGEHKSELMTTDNESQGNISERTNNGKLEQFQSIISEVVSNALKENTGMLGKEVSEIVSDNVIKEMDYLMHIREKQEEERFKKLDETIRSCQLHRKESAKIKRGIFSRIKKIM